MNQSDPLVFAVKAASLSDAALLAELEAADNKVVYWRQALRDEAHFRRLAAMAGQRISNVTKTN